MKVVFAHNVYNRLKTLKETILVEKNIFPDASISVACNDMFINIFQEITNFSIVLFDEKPHKIGCVNGCILSIKKLLDTDFDVLIFSHDDVSINTEQLDVLMKNINYIESGEYDVICRKPIGWEKYYMMEVFYMSKKTALMLFENIDILKSEKEIPLDFRRSVSPEVWLYNLISNKNLNILEIEYINKLEIYNEQLKNQMGFNHKNAGLRGWND